MLYNALIIELTFLYNILWFFGLFEFGVYPYWQISGVWPRPNPGKLIQPKFMGTYSVLFKFEA